MRPSRYVIPCLCGASVESHEDQAVCARCGRLLDVSAWGEREQKKEEEKNEA